MKMQDLQDDKRNSNNSFSSNRASLRISTVTINSDTVLPPPVHFTTTIYDPPMPIHRNSPRSKYYQKNLKNLNYPSETNTEENWSLLDNLSLYDKIFNNDTLNGPNINKNGQKEEQKVAEQREEVEVEYSNPLSNPYNSSLTPEPFSSSPILSRFSFFESNKSSIDNNNKKKVRFNTRISNYSQTDESQLQYASSDSETSSRDNYYVKTDLSSREKGKKFKTLKPNKPRTWKELWMMPWRDEETKRLTKKFWLMLTVIICLILLLVTIALCLIFIEMH